MKRVLVTGGTGFVGTHLVTQLLNSGCDVILASRGRHHERASSKAVRTVAYDLSNPDSFDVSALQGVDCIFHLAAQVHVMQPTPGDEARFTALNVKATEALALQAAAAEVPRFVYLSSIKVNGERTLGEPFSGDSEPSPEDAYGKSKWMAERALTRIARTSRLEVAVVRPPLVYGPGVGANFLRLLDLAATGVPLPLARVNNRRSLVNVWNLVSLLLRVASDPKAAGKTWLVSDNEDVSTPQLLHLLGDVARVPVRLWPAPLHLLRGAARVVNRRAEMSRLLDSLQVDIAITRAELNWEPTVSVTEGLARTAAWHAERKRR